MERASVISSSTHKPVSSPLPGPAGLKKRETRKDLRRASTIATSALVTTMTAARKPPPRGESTQHPYTSPEATDWEDTAGEETSGKEPWCTLPQEGLWVKGASVAAIAARDDDSDWIGEQDEDNEKEYLLVLEYHSSLVRNVNKWKR